MLLVNKGNAKRLAYMAALLALALLAVLISATAAGAQRQKVATVSIRDFYFEPSQLTIEPGTTVQWVNEGSTQHTVFATSPAGAFLSGTLNPGESFTYTFPQHFPKASPDSPTTSGTYRYYCQIHPDMRASITFSESGREAPKQKEQDTSIEQPPTAPVIQGREATSIQQSSTTPVIQGREDTTIQQPAIPPSTGGLNPVLLLGLPVVVVVAVVILGWTVKRRSSQRQRE